MTLSIVSATLGTVFVDEFNTIYFTPSGTGWGEIVYTLTDPFGATSTGFITIQIFEFQVTLP